MLKLFTLSTVYTLTLTVMFTLYSVTTCVYVKFQAVAEKTAKKIVGKTFSAALTCIENHANGPGVNVLSKQHHICLPLQLLMQN